MWDEIIDFVTEIPSNIADFFESAFDNMGEFSYYGLAFAAVSVGVILFTKKWTLDPFLVHMNGVSATFWMIATFVLTAIAGYFVGKHFENS